jgi:cardiolipin synthase
MWASEKVCLKPQAYFDLIGKAIAEARQTVRLEMYIFQLDELGLRLLSAMRAAARRGVHVRIVVDGFGSPAFGRDLVASLKEQGVFVRVYHPTPRIPDLFGLFSLHKAGAFFSTINKRNHRKLVVVDDRTAFVGSCNVSSSHCEWRETAVRLTGAAVSELSRSFELIWSRAGYSGLTRAAKLRARLRARRSLGDRRRIKGPGAVRTNVTRPLRLHHNSAMTALIEKSVDRVWITTAYFVPSPSVLAALLKATRNGSDVKLLLPGISDVTAVSYVSRMFYRGLLRAGVQIFEYQPAVLHAKTLIIDDWVCVGTTNLNHRSFYHDLEVDVTLYDKAVRDVLVAQYERDQQMSSRITVERLMNRSALEKIGGYLIYPFRRWI